MSFRCRRQGRTAGSAVARRGRTRTEPPPCRRVERRPCRRSVRVARGCATAYLDSTDRGDHGSVAPPALTCDRLRSQLSTAKGRSLATGRTILLPIRISNAVLDGSVVQLLDLNRSRPVVTEAESNPAMRIPPREAALHKALDRRSRTVADRVETAVGLISGDAEIGGRSVCTR